MATCILVAVFLSLLALSCSDDDEPASDAASELLSDMDSGGTADADADAQVDAVEDTVPDSILPDGDDPLEDLSSDTEDVAEDAAVDAAVDAADFDTAEVCVPDCSDLACGPDPVCGTSCGECSGGKTCVEGLCLFTIYPGTCSETTLADNDNNEVWDARTVVTNRYSSGAVLVLSRTEEFPGTDDTVLKARQNSYWLDARELVSIHKQTLDQNGDDVYDDLSLDGYTYDENKRVVAYLGEEWGDSESGPALERYREAITYDEDGNVLSDSWEEDWNADGTADYLSSQTFTYNEDGQELLHLYEYDENADGTAELFRIWESTYDEDGNLVQSMSGAGYHGDERLIEVLTTTTTYDDSGLAVSRLMAYDDGDDDVIEITTTFTWTYDSEGHKLQEVMDYVNANNSAANFRNTQIWTYDDDGRIINLQDLRDNLADGTDDYITTMSYTWNADGNPLSEVLLRDDDGDGTPHSRQETTWEYDTEGRKIRWVRCSDTDMNELCNHTNTLIWTFDEFGNMLTERQEQNLNENEPLEKLSVRTIGYECFREHTEVVPLDPYEWEASCGGTTCESSAVVSIAEEPDGLTTQQLHVSTDFDGDFAISTTLAQGLDVPEGDSMLLSFFVRAENPNPPDGDSPWQSGEPGGCCPWVVVSGEDEEMRFEPTENLLRVHPWDWTYVEIDLMGDDRWTAIGTLPGAIEEIEFHTDTVGTQPYEFWLDEFLVRY